VVDDVLFWCAWACPRARGTDGWMNRATRLDAREGRRESATRERRATARCEEIGARARRDGVSCGCTPRRRDE